MTPLRLDTSPELARNLGLALFKTIYALTKDSTLLYTVRYFQEKTATSPAHRRHEQHEH